MKFYEVVYEDESKPDGFAHHFFTSRKEAEKCVADLKRQYAEEVKAHDEWEGDFYEKPAYPVFRVERISIEELEFTGTCKQIVLQALAYGNG